MRTNVNSIVFAVAMAVAVLFFGNTAAAQSLSADLGNEFAETSAQVSRDFTMFVNDVRGRRDDPNSTTREDIATSRTTFRQRLDLQREVIVNISALESGTDRNEAVSVVVKSLADDASDAAQGIFSEVNGLDGQPAGYGPAARAFEGYLDELKSQLELVRSVWTDETDFHVSGIALSSVILARDQLRTLETEERDTRNRAHRDEDRAYARVSEAIAVASEYGYPYPSDAMDHFTRAATEHRHARNTHRVIRAQADFFAEIAAELEALPRIETPDEPEPETVDIMVEAETIESSDATSVAHDYLGEAIRMISRAHRVEIPPVIAVQPQAYRPIEVQMGGLAVTGPIFGYTEDRNVSLLSLSEMREAFEEPERAAAGQESPPADTTPSVPPDPADQQHEQLAPEETAPRLQIEPENIRPLVPGSEEPTAPPADGSLEIGPTPPAETEEHDDSATILAIVASGIAIFLVALTMFLVALLLKEREAKGATAGRHAEQVTAKEAEIECLQRQVQTLKNVNGTLEKGGHELERQVEELRAVTLHDIAEAVRRARELDDLTALLKAAIGERKHPLQELALRALRRGTVEGGMGVSPRSLGIAELTQVLHNLRNELDIAARQRDKANERFEEERERVDTFSSAVLDRDDFIVKLQTQVEGLEKALALAMQRANEAEKTNDALANELNAAHEALYDASRSRRGSRGQKKEPRRAHTEPDGLPAAVSFASGDDFHGVPLPDATAEANESPAPHLPAVHSPPTEEPTQGSQADTAGLPTTATADFPAVPFAEDGTSGNN